MDSFLLIVGMLLFSAIGVNLMLKKDNVVYVSAPYEQTLEYQKEKVDQFLEDTKKERAEGVKFLQEVSRTGYVVVDAPPQPGAWAIEDEDNSPGPPYYVYRDESTGKSMIAVRGTRMYIEILNGTKNR